MRHVHGGRAAPAPPEDNQEAPAESPVRTLNVRLPEAHTYADEAHTDVTFFLRQPGARDARAGNPQGATGGGLSAGEPEPAHADSAGDAHPQPGTGAGERTAGREAEYIAAIEDYVLSVAADGTTTARPSIRHGGESPLGDSEAGIRANDGAPSVASARAPRHKPSTPLMPGPWDDHAPSESDYTAMIQGETAAQVPSNDETTNIRCGSTLTRAGGDTKAVKLVLYPRSSKRKSSKSPERVRQVALLCGSSRARPIRQCLPFPPHLVPVSGHPSLLSSL
jgi:hypothetical protein